MCFNISLLIYKFGLFRFFLLTFSKERAELEDTYAKGLRKLAEGKEGGFLKSNAEGLTKLPEAEIFRCAPFFFLNPTSCRSVKEVWLALKEECDQRAVAHRELQLCLAKNLTTTRDFAKEQKRIRKQVPSDISGILIGASISRMPLMWQKNEII